MPKRKKDIPDKFPYDDSDVISVDDVYTIISYVQLHRRSCSFIANERDAVTMENLFIDVDFKFDKKEHSRGVQFFVEPPPEKEESDHEIIFLDENLPDEKIEPGQCF